MIAEPGGASHDAAPPSPWVMRFAREWAVPSRVLDLACGSGRHVRALAALGHHVSAADRDSAALHGLHGLHGVACERLQVDLEAEPWPLAGRSFDALVITNYLWRPRLAEALALVAPGGWWLHETFGAEQASIGRPTNPAFLLRPGELLEVAAAQGLRVVAYEDLRLDQPPRFVQRIAARRPGGHEAPGR